MNHSRKNHNRKWIYRRMKMWMKWIVFFTVCQNTLCIEEPYRLLDANTRCLEIKVESRLSCTNNGQFYHCLLDENYTKEFEVCRDWKWIPGGKCGYFNSYGRGNIDVRNCVGNATLKCATGQFRSNSNTKYNACYVKKKITITTPIVPVTVRPTGSGASDVLNTTETAPTESTPTESQFNGSAFGISLGVIVPLILLVVVPGIVLFKKRCHTQGTSQRETAVERGEGDALMDTETRCLAENEQNQQQIEKDEGTSTEDKESLPPLAGNKNENQSESQLKENQDNESFKTPPTTPAVQTEPDTDIGRTENKDDKKNEMKEGKDSHGGHDSSEEVSLGAGVEKKKEEGSMERDPSVDEVLPDDSVEDDLHSSSANDKNGDNGKQKIKVTEEVIERKDKEEDVPKDSKVIEGIFVDSLESITKEDDDEGTSTEDKEASPLLAENKNENQSEENSMKNQDTSEFHNFGSPQKNESFLTPLTTPAVQTEPDTDIERTEIKDDEKNEMKDGEGSRGGHNSSEEVSLDVGAEKKTEEGSIEGNHSTDAVSPDNGAKDDPHLSGANDKFGDNGNQTVEATEEDESEKKDNEEDSSHEIKVTEGIFVDSLESITKKDDEEGGWSELQELLEYMCTGPARKILFNVVKEYGDNPDNYFQDESKKALLKSVLPTEFHSALDHTSEYRHSIPVMHAILQVSLSEKYQPKSGWGQKVKDTDTGVGDDVERVYQVHTLRRGIQNPEEISADGYVRIFEMFIGAVERLDIKGKCSEYYREIVRRWENIQRKQWMKDKWTTFTNFINKWS